MYRMLSRRRAAQENGTRANENCYNSRMRASIWLKFATCIGGLSANNSMKFGIDIRGVNGTAVIKIIMQKPNKCNSQD